MNYHLPDHCSFGTLGSRVVFLDLEADRYFLLRSAEASAVLAPHPEISHSISALIARNLLAAGPGNAVRPISAVKPLCGALEASDIDGHLPVSELLFFRSEASIMLRFLGLQATFARLRRVRRRSLSSSSRDRLWSADEASRLGASLARGYSRARIFVPAARLCVPDSIALARSLWRRGVGADLYFGVRLDPFAAHCWLQYTDLLLTDPLNFVADYTPVFRL